MTQNTANTATKLTDRAMLAGLSIRVWSGRVRAKQIEATASDFNANPSWVSSSQLVVAKHRLAKARKIAGLGRNTFRAMTLPWLDTGKRLLPTDQYLRTQKIMSELEAQFSVEVDAFKAVYQDAIEEARQSLGELFNPDHYPSEEELNNLFEWSFSVDPLPSSGDFRVDVNHSVHQQLKKDYEQRVNRQFEEATKEVFNRVSETCRKLSDRLKKSASGEAQRMHETNLTNLRDLVDMLPALNVTGNAELTRLTEQLRRDFFTSESPDFQDMKNDPAVAADTAEKVDSILSTFGI